MSNKDFYKDIMSGIQPSEQAVERILNMANIEKNKKSVLKPVLAIAVCIAMVLTGIFAGSNALLKSKNPADKSSNTNISHLGNSFILTAYAEDSKESQNITKSTKYTMQTSKINAYYDNSGVYTVEMSGGSKFEVKGDNIKSVRYQCDNGTFGLCVDFNKMNYLKNHNKYYDAIIPYSEDLQELSDSELNKKIFENYESGNYDKYFKEKKPLSDYLKAEKIYDDKEIIGIGFLSHKVYQSVSSEISCNDFTYVNYLNSEKLLNYACWKPDIKELFDANGKPSKKSFDELEHAKLTITVEYNDCSMQVQTYNLSFSKNGNLEIQKSA